MLGPAEAISWNELDPCVGRPPHLVPKPEPRDIGTKLEHVHQAALQQLRRVRRGKDVGQRLRYTNSFPA